MWSLNILGMHLAVTGIPQVEVDSDLRQLFAVGALEGYEKLKCENRELLGLLSAMQARVNHRLKTFSSVTMSEVSGQEDGDQEKRITWERGGGELAHITTGSSRYNVLEFLLLIE